MIVIVFEFFHKCTKLVILTLLPTLYSHICSFLPYLQRIYEISNEISVDVIGFYFNVVYFIGLIIFYGKAITELPKWAYVLQRVCEKAIFVLSKSIAIALHFAFLQFPIIRHRFSEISIKPYFVMD